MILQALAKYYAERIKLPSGFQKKEIHFIITIDSQGRFVSLLDTRTDEGKTKRARVCLVPREIKRAGSKAWEKANILWDTPAYVAGISSKDFANAPRKHQSFVKRFKEVFPNPLFDIGIGAVSTFLANGDFVKLQEHSSWSDVLETDGYLTFKLDDDECLVCERSTVKEWLSNSQGAKEKTMRGVCLVSGDDDEIAQLHNAIKGVRGAQSTGANIVSFNLSAFESYGKSQSYNAPIGKKAEFAYVTALNGFLAKDSPRKIYVGDTTTVFWSEKEHEIEDWFKNIFGEPNKVESDQDNATIRALFESMKTGTPPLEWNLNQFYVLGLSPNAARIAIRFWYAGTVAEVATNILQHFEDISIVHADYEMPNCSLNELLASTAVETKDPKKTNRVYFRGKYYDVTPNLAGDFMKAILASMPYPRTLLSAVITRVKAEQSKKDSKTGKSIQNVSYPRAALIKAILNREARYRNSNIKEVGMSLDTSNINPGYLLGRLFAVLEKVQIESAGGEGKINATIRDRFYGSASSTPVVAFPSLMKLKNHHLAKLESYKSVYEKLIGEITDKLTADKSFPSHLSLDDQGRFAVGYYHQRQDFFKKKVNS